jgi:hypothetical protein
VDAEESLGGLDREQLRDDRTQSPPWKTYRGWPSRSINSWNALAIRAGLQPVDVGMPEKP